MTEQQTAGQPNPAKVARNRIIAALQGQQAIITRLAHDNEVLKTALRDVVTGAGLQNLPRFASLMATAADTNNNPDGAPATTTEEAKKPDATDSVENVGGTPGANGNVTPAAVTDVQNSNVAADAPVLDNLQDVTAPVGGTDAPTPAAATGEGEITSKAPSNDVMDPAGSTGWTTSSRGDDQSRFVASLRLARLQISAGVAAGEDLTVAQAIFDGTDSLDVIAAQASTLSAVASKQASAQPGQQHRHLVPQPSRPGVRAASLQSPIQPTAAVSGGRGEDEFMFGLSVD